MSKRFLTIASGGQPSPAYPFAGGSDHYRMDGRHLLETWETDATSAPVWDSAGIVDVGRFADVADLSRATLAVCELLAERDRIEHDTHWHAAIHLPGIKPRDVVLACYPTRDLADDAPVFDPDESDADGAVWSVWSCTDDPRECLGLIAGE